MKKILHNKVKEEQRAEILRIMAQASLGWRQRCYLRIKCSAHYLKSLQLACKPPQACKCCERWPKLQEMPHAERLMIEYSCAQWPHREMAIMVASFFSVKLERKAHYKVLEEQR